MTTTTLDGTQTSKALVSALLEQIGRVNDSRQQGIALPPNKILENLKEGRHRKDCVDNGDKRTDSEHVRAHCYDGSFHDILSYTIKQNLRKDVKDKKILLIGSGCKKEVLAIFTKVQKHAIHNVRTATNDSAKQAATKMLLTEEADTR